MKRSRSIELALMGGVPLLLAGCGSPHHEQTLLYDDVQQCIADGQVPAVNCEEGYERSLAAQENAPHFDTMAQCEAEYGEQQCRPVQASPEEQARQGTWFVPLASGFLIARAIDHPGYYDGYDGSWWGAGSWYVQPVYRVRGGGNAWQTASGQRFNAANRGPGAYSVSETISRGGFGRSGTARFGWGG